MGERIVILTGAGISAESGLGTFRDAGGIWAQYDLEEVATPEGFARDPAKVHAFYNARRENCRSAEPNAAHHALARLQAAHEGTVTLITQNIDDLFARAGAAAIHMHGELMRARCDACGARWPAPLRMAPEDACAQCGARATRPDVVWFGEMPHHLDEIFAALGAADRFVAIGTSGAVQPAGNFVREAAAAGAHTLELNLEPSEASPLFAEARHGPASALVPDWVAQMLGARGGI